MKRTPLNRRTPMKRPKGPKKPAKALRGTKKGRRKSFSAKYPPDHPGPRYGPLFRAVREMPCWLAVEGYRGPKHERCGPGAQTGHTAHHVGRNDADGLLPVCGLAHDLCANIAGRLPQKEFSAWLEAKGWTLESVALDYIAGNAVGSEHG